MPKKRTVNVRPGQTNEDIGNRLRAFRIERGLSQQELGQKLDVTFQQIQKYEKGTNGLSALRAIEIANIFKTTPNELLGCNGAMKIAKPFDAEAFKLAQALTRLRDGLKPAFRHVITAVMDEN